MFVEKKKKVYRIVSSAAIGISWPLIGWNYKNQDQVRVRSAFQATGCFGRVGPFLNLTNLGYLRGRSLQWLGHNRDGSGGRDKGCLGSSRARDLEDSAFFTNGSSETSFWRW